MKRATIAWILLGALACSPNAFANESATLQKQFFEAVGSGKLGNVMSLLDSRVIDYIDPPLLNDWMNAVAKQLGKFQSVDPKNSTVNRVTKGGFDQRLVDSTVHFEHGVAHSELDYYKGKIIRFQVDSPQLDDTDWFRGPTDTSYYRNMAVDFCRDIAGGNLQAARYRMHPSLQENVSSERLQQFHRAFVNEIGELSDVQVIGDKFLEFDNLQQQRIELLVIGSKATYKSVVSYGFFGLRAQMIEFDLTQTKLGDK